MQRDNMDNCDQYIKPQKGNLDTKKCFVPTCSSNSVKHSSKRFFVVPAIAKIEWCNAVGANCLKRSQYICEDHLNFQEDIENYENWILKKMRPKLRVKLPRCFAQVHNEPIPSCSSMEPKLNFCHKAVQVKVRVADRSTLCALNVLRTKFKPKEDITEDIDEDIPSTQGSTTSAVISEASSISVPAKVPGSLFIMNIIEKKPQTYIGLTKDYYWLIKYLASKLKLKSLHIVITLYKIKNNTPFNQISDLFGVSLTTLWRFFYRTLSILQNFFKELIFRPNMFDVKRNLPSCFTTNKEYANVYCIIDCFEVEIEKPSDPIQQSLTWSQYKNANTLKFLVAITPDGFVCFISAGYGGRISDAKIVARSGFLDVMPENSTILADRGFKHIESMLCKKNIKLLRPPSVSKGVKLTKEEAIQSKVIASLRIHVERVIRRIRLFRILKPHSVINNKLIKYSDDIAIIACGLINLQSSIIKNE